MEAVGRACADRGWMFALAAHLFATALPIDRFATPEQTRRWLKPWCDGAWVGGNAITEADAGSDVFALQTRATAVEGGYVLDGEKSYVTNAPWARLLLVYARTRPDFGVLGISAFLVPQDAAGVRLGPARAKVGLTTAQACPIVLERCFLPAEQRLGAEGQGAAIFEYAMTWVFHYSSSSLPPSSRARPYSSTR